MPNIQNIILEKMENNECDIYSKTNTNCTFYIQRFELFNTERLFCRFVFRQQPISLLNAWVQLEGGWPETQVDKWPCCQTASPGAAVHLDSIGLRGVRPRSLYYK